MARDSIVTRTIVALVTIMLVSAVPMVARAQDKPQATATSEFSGLHGVFGEHVKDLNGDDAGRLWDILIDDAGKPRAAVIDYGGALGVGQRKVAVGWDLLQFVAADAKTPIHLALTMQQLGTLPEFKYGTEPAVVGTGQ
jgi:PRC-barrel domain